MRSLFAIVTLVVVSVGCSPEAAKTMTDKATGGVTDAAKGAAEGLGAGVTDMLGKATEALSGVEGGADMLKQVTE